MMEKAQSLVYGKPNVAKKKYSPPFVAVKKLSGQNVVRVAAKHNLREIQAEVGAGEHIEPTRMHLNQVVVGPSVAANVVADGERLMEEAGVGKLRRDAVRAIEIVISLPLVNTVDQSVFFSDALNWVRDYYNVPILSAVIHLDESAPHCHVLLLPLIGGR